MCPDVVATPDLYRAVRGAAQRGGTAPRAVLRLDQGPVGAGMPGDSGVSQAELFALRRDSGAGPADGLEHLSAAENGAPVARPQPATDDDADANRLHHHVFEIPRRSYTLLFLLQCAGNRPAVLPQPRI